MLHEGWTRDDNLAAWELILEHTDSAMECNQDAFVAFHSTSTSECDGLNDREFEARIAEYQQAAGKAARYLKETTARFDVRRARLVDIFKQFDLNASGDLDLEEFKNVGEALHPDG